ncbi:CidA/LrgA family protein [Oryzomonas sagensis]|nr:CidA/LrgA family protein [Oryzomonas sagensis]
MTIYQRMSFWLRRFRLSRPFQALLILLFWALGEAIVRITGIAIPGAIVGLLIMLALLVGKRLRVRTVRRGAEWYLAEMLLFFVPAVLAVLDHPEFLGLLGVKILAVIVLGTLTVMTVTAGAIDLCYRLGKEDVDVAK